MHPFENAVKKVLVVISEEPLQKELTSFLNSTDRFTAISCSTSSEALEVLRKGRIDAIVAETQLMRKTEPLCLEAIQEGIPTILIANDFEDSVKTIRSYALKVPVLKKPVDPLKLADLLIQYLGGTRAEGVPFMAAWWEDPENA